MKKTLARALSLALVLVTLFSLLPVNTFAATTQYDTSKYTKNLKLQKNLSTILNGSYGPGKYFTQNGKACTCHLEDTDEERSEHCNCLYNPKFDGKKVNLGSSQCLGYARYFQRMLFGVDEHNNGKQFKKLKGASFYNSSKKKYDGDKCKKWFEDNKSNLHLGTHIRCYDGKHSIVLLAVNYKKGNVTFLQCNWSNQGTQNSGWCKVNPITTLSWQAFAKTFHSIKYANVLKDFNDKYPPDYKVKAYATATNTTASIVGSVEGNPSVETWSLGIGVSEAEVKAMKVSGKTPANIANTDTFYYFNNDKDGVFSVNKIRGLGLLPGIKLYYRVCAKIGGRWYQSDVNWVSTTILTPRRSLLSVADNSVRIGRGDRAQLSWTESNDTDSYTLVVKDSSETEIQRIENLVGRTFELDPIDTAGEYTVTVYSNGNTGDVTVGESKTVTVMDDVTVTFYDTVENEILAETVIPYGHSAATPPSPSHYGYSFINWDGSFEKVTEDVTINTVFSTSSYTVRFIDSFTNEVLGNAQSVPYGSAATAPTNLDFSQHTGKGYEFVGWDKDFSHIEKDTDVYTVFKWQDENHSADLILNSVTPHPGSESGTSIGYDISCTISNKLTEKISGRIVAVLKSSTGAILTQTDSTAFVVDESSLSAGGMIEPTSRTFTFFVKYPLYADQIEIYLVNDYAKLGQMSETAVMSINNGSLASDWILYEGECPVQDGNITIDDYSETETLHYYRYRKELTSSSPVTPEGFTQNGYTLVENSHVDNYEYVASWPSGFLKSNTLYKTLNKPAMTASETDTQVVVIDSTETSGYIYWHWCYGEKPSGGPLNRWIEGAKGNKCETFHAFRRSTALTFNTSAKCYKYANSSKCPDTYWWYGKTPDKAGDLVIKKQHYTVYDKQYSYISGYSDWIPYTDDSELPIVGATTGDGTTVFDIETKEETHVWHRYRYDSAAEVDYEPDPACKVSVSEPITEPSLSGDVTVWIYKYTQASDFTTEYVGAATVIDDGESKRIDLDDIYLREAQYRGGPDYTIAVSAPGYEQAFVIGTIEAPKKLCTVTFYDEFNRVVKVINNIEEGDSILPEEQPVLTFENSQISEGKELVGWRDSLSDIRHEALHVYPIVVAKKFTITKVDWNNQTISFVNDCAFGDPLPELSDSPTAVEGYETDWYVMTENGYTLYDEYKAQEGTIKSNLLIVSKNTPIVWNVTIVDADYDRNLLDYSTGYDIKNYVEHVDDSEDPDDDMPEEPSNGENEIDELENPLSIQIHSTLQVENGCSIDYSALADVEEAEEIDFIDWMNAADDSIFDGTNVTQNLVLYPKYLFPDTVDDPVADKRSGEYEAEITVSLECATESAVIWYTINGEDPRTDPNAIMYTGPITISDHAILQYYAAALGYNDSGTETRIYIINDNTGEPVKHLISLIPLKAEDSMRLYELSLIMVDENSSVSSVITDYDKVDGYTLEALYWDADFSEAVDLDDPITASAEIYMKYTLKQYTVTFVDEEENTIDVKTVAHGASVEAPQCTLEKEGYVFAGWDADLECITEDIIVRPRFIAEDEYATVEILKQGVTLYAGSQMVLTASITPICHNGYDIIWTSEDEDIVSVDKDGVITGESCGTTRIIATLPYTGAKSYCTVKVVSNPEQQLVLMHDCVFRFDSERNLRIVPSIDHTVNDILSGFENASLIVCAADGTELAGTDTVGTGCVVKLMSGEELLDSATIILVGDYNGDGMINNKDVVMLNQLVLEKREADYWQALAVDVNGDGYVNNKDCAMLARYLVGKEVL